MAPIEEELQALRAQLAALTMRIYRLEEKAGIQGQPNTHATPPPAVAPPPIPEKLARSPREIAATRTSASSTPFGALPKSSSTPRPKDSDLEGTIGKLWLNRIGIIAILIGVAYFLKYAFDSHWIGETGRVAIGIAAGIAVIVWSERFRTHGQEAFSYSLKAVGIGTL